MPAMQKTVMPHCFLQIVCYWYSNGLFWGRGRDHIISMFGWSNFPFAMYSSRCGAIYMYTIHSLFGAHHIAVSASGHYVAKDAPLTAKQFWCYGAIASKFLLVHQIAANWFCSLAIARQLLPGKFSVCVDAKHLQCSSIRVQRDI